jgi:hypothetical protein
VGSSGISRSALASGAERSSGRLLPGNLGGGADGLLLARIETIKVKDDLTLAADRI